MRQNGSLVLLLILSIAGCTNEPAAPDRPEDGEDAASGSAAPIAAPSVTASRETPGWLLLRLAALPPAGVGSVRFEYTSAVSEGASSDVAAVTMFYLRGSVATFDGVSVFVGAEHFETGWRSWPEGVDGVLFLFISDSAAPRTLNITTVNTKIGEISDFTGSAGWISAAGSFRDSGGRLSHGVVEETGAGTPAVPSQNVITFRPERAPEEGVWFSLTCALGATDGLSRRETTISHAGGREAFTGASQPFGGVLHIFADDLEAPLEVEHRDEAVGSASATTFLHVNARVPALAWDLERFDTRVLGQASAPRQCGA